MDNIIIFDSKCSFCTKTVFFFITNKKKALLSIPVQDKDARLKLRTLGENFISLQTIYFISNNRVYKKSQAIFQIVRNLNFPYNTLSVFSILPISLTDFFYDYISKRRHKIKI